MIRWVYIDAHDFFVIDDTDRARDELQKVLTHPFFYQVGQMQHGPVVILKPVIVNSRQFFIVSHANQQNASPGVQESSDCKLPGMVIVPE
jgi:hypothetical protein